MMHQNLIFFLQKTFFLWRRFSLKQDFWKGWLCLITKQFCMEFENVDYGNVSQEMVSVKWLNIQILRLNIEHLLSCSHHMQGDHNIIKDIMKMTNFTPILTATISRTLCYHCVSIKTFWLLWSYAKLQLSLGSKEFLYIF